MKANNRTVFLLAAAFFPALLHAQQISPLPSGARTVVMTPDGVLRGPENVALVAADGYASFLPVLTVFNYGPGNVEFTILDGTVEENGGVGATYCTARESSITIHTYPIGNNAHQAFAWYRAPDEFNRGGDDHLTSRRFSLRLRFIPDSGDPPLVAELLQDLTRPPLVLVHGTWSSPDTWRFSLASEPEQAEPRLVVVHRADYESSNAASFGFNDTRGVVSRAVNQALWELHEYGQSVGYEGTAVERVDVAAHSLGGLLTRTYATGGVSLTSGRCDSFAPIRKFITLDTPHFGTLLANVACALLRDELVGRWFRDYASEQGFPMHLGAVKDQQIGSFSIQELRAVDVPAHALVGIGGRQYLDGSTRSGFAKVVRGMLAWSQQELWLGEEHDLLVHQTSQRGGLASPALNDYGLPDGLHFAVADLPGATGSEAYGDRIFALLDAPTSSSPWERFPPPPPAPLPEDLCDVPSNVTPAKGLGAPRSLLGNTATIVTPAPGTVVTPGQPVTVTVIVVSDQAIELVEVVGAGASAETTTTPYIMNFPVPEELIGPFNIQAFVTTASGGLFGSEPVTLVAEPGAALTAIRIAPDRELLRARGLGGESSLRLKGIYADDVERTLDPAEATWLSSDPAVFAVSPEGVVTAVGVGSGTVTAQVGAFFDFAKVIVTGPIEHIFGDHFESGNTDRWAQTVGTVSVGDVGYEEKGLEVDLEGGSPAFVQDDTPDRESTYFGRFALRVWPLTMASGDEFDLFVALNAGGEPQLRLSVRRMSDESVLRWWVATDTGSIETPPGEEVPLPKGWRVVDIGWTASDPGQQNGQLRLRVDGNEFVVFTGVANEDSRIDAIRLGAVGGLDPGTSGSFFLDSFGARRDRYVQVPSVFRDVRVADPCWQFAHAIYNHEVTSGCGGGNYCPADSVSLEQTAAFLLRSKEGPGYVPPACTSAPFNDVPPNSLFCPWIQELANRGITGGCGDGNYCPGDPATREHVASLLLKTLEGSGYTPPACVAGEEMFNDVPASSEFCPWIEELARRGIASGCGDGNFCPGQVVDNCQMAELLTGTFSLLLPPQL